MEYRKIGWKNSQDEKSTPLSAENLNHMDDQIEALTDAVNAFDGKPEIFVLTAAPDASLGKVGDIAAVIING